MTPGQQGTELMDRQAPRDHGRDHGGGTTLGAARHETRGCCRMVLSSGLHTFHVGVILHIEN